jgi:tRNA(His) guanylyltransferase
MKSGDLAGRLRPFETASDRCVPPEVFMVARLDGRGFGKLARIQGDEISRPFDVRVRDAMVATTEHLMHGGFQVVYGYTQSDEISLLLHRDERCFGRKLRKILSVLAGEASARFSLLIGEVAAFDCRVSELPNAGLVVDYFRWRQDDAARNALGAHCTWALRRAGVDAAEATRVLAGASVADRNELLRRHGINFNSDVPAWQKRGVGLAWATFTPPPGQPGAPRRHLRIELELAMKEAYDEYVRGLVGLAVAGE